MHAPYFEFSFAFVSEHYGKKDILHPIGHPIGLVRRHIPCIVGHSERFLNGEGRNIPVKSEWDWAVIRVVNAGLFHIPFDRHNPIGDRVGQKYDTIVRKEKLFSSVFANAFFVPCRGRYEGFLNKDGEMINMRCKRQRALFTSGSTPRA